MQTLLEVRQYRAAVDAARVALERAPTEIDALVVAADAFSKDGLVDEARKLGRRAVELYPDDSRAWVCLGWSEQAAGDWDSGVRALGTAVNLSPDVSMWRNNLGWQLGAARPRDALRSFDRALQLDPENRLAARNRIVALTLLGRTKVASRLREEWRELELEQARKRVEASPGDAAALSMYARGLRDQRCFEDALAAAQRAHALDPSADHTGLVIDLHGLLGRYDVERSLLDRAQAELPDDLNLLHQRAWLGATVGDAAYAHDAVERLRAVEQNATHLLLAEACAAAAAGEWEHAAASFERALDARPLDCCTHAWLGISYVEQGRIEDARRKLVDAEVRTPVKCTTAGELSRRLEGRAA